MTDRDFSKYRLVVVTAALREQPDPCVVATGGVWFEETPIRLKAHVEIIGLEAVHGFIEAALEGLKTARNPEFFLQKGENQVYLYIDQTEAYSDFHGEIPSDPEISTAAVVLTNSREVDENGLVYQIPRRDVTAALVNTYQQGRIQIAGNLPFTENLKSTLPDLRIKGADDAGTVEIAIGLICWAAAQREYEPGGAYEQYSTGDDAEWGLPE